MDVSPGPLIRPATGKLWSHMPMAVDSTYTHLLGALKKAYRLSCDSGTPDAEFDLEGRTTPKFGQQTWRRTSDKMAKLSAKAIGSTKEERDAYYGWGQAVAAKDMQTHYAGRGERATMAKITSLI